MTGKTFLFVGAGVLFLIGLCLVAFAGITLYGSTAPTGQASWASTGVVLGIFGLLFFAGGAAMIVAAQRGTKTEIIQQVKIDLPGETKIEEMKCKSCGGTLSAKNITLVNGAPMVNCPYCGSTYQLTEEPKW
jgi:DNA-directed RNA polymerase subunit RPC12/RpoP